LRGRATKGSDGWTVTSVSGNSLLTDVLHRAVDDFGRRRGTHRCSPEWCVPTSLVLVGSLPRLVSVATVGCHRTVRRLRRPGSGEPQGCQRAHARFVGREASRACSRGMRFGSLLPGRRGRSCGMPGFFVVRGGVLHLLSYVSPPGLAGQPAGFGCSRGAPQPLHRGSSSWPSKPRFVVKGAGCLVFQASGWWCFRFVCEQTRRRVGATGRATVRPGRWCHRQRRFYPDGRRSMAGGRGNAQGTVIRQAGGLRTDAQVEQGCVNAARVVRPSSGARSWRTPRGQRPQ
jgi:hypothetical protein